MTKFFNKNSQLEKRRTLRNNSTKAEMLLWEELKGKKINGHKFRRQFSIEVYVVDFYCAKLRLAIEVDGVTHTAIDEIEYDKNRQSEIESLGIVFLRFTNKKIYEDMGKVIEKIRKKTEELS